MKFFFHFEIFSLVHNRPSKKMIVEPSKYSNKYINHFIKLKLDICEEYFNQLSSLEDEPYDGFSLLVIINIFLKPDMRYAFLIDSNLTKRATSYLISYDYISKQLLLLSKKNCIIVKPNRLIDLFLNKFRYLLLGASGLLHNQEPMKSEEDRKELREYDDYIKLQHDIPNLYPKLLLKRC